MDSQSRLYLYLFGFPHMERGGRTVEVDTRKAIALLAYLTVTGETVSRDSLAVLLWPEYDQTSARAALRRTLSVLNKAVGQGYLDIERERVRIHPDSSIWVDVTSFRQALSLCDSQYQLGNQKYLQTLEDAVNLARYRFMAGFSLRDTTEFDDWQFYQAERFGRDVAGSLQKLVLGYAYNHDWEKALQFGHQWLNMDLLNEEAHRQLMILYAQSNQRNAALRQYRECVRILDQELGVAPLDETTELYQSILENRIPALQTPLATSYSQISKENQYSGSIKKEFTAEELGRVRLLPLVGRVWELDGLRAAYEHARKEGQIMLLEGEAGIGKTRLAEDFIQWATRQGSRTLLLRCYEGEAGLAYGPFIDGLNTAINQPDGLESIKAIPEAALAEAARLSQQISARMPGLTVSSPLEGHFAQSRFFESIREVILSLVAGPQPGMLLMDDIQWADVASQDLLAYLIQRLAGTGLLVLLTFPDDASLKNKNLVASLTAARRKGLLTRRVLNRLEADDITRLVESIPAHHSLPENMSERLYRETEGLPFFAVEYLYSILAGGKWELPATVRDLLLHHLDGIDDAALQLLSTAAVIGRSFDFPLLKEVSGRSEMETVNGLERLLAHHLIVERQASNEQVEIRYDFSHEKMRSLVYEQTSLARRRLLHKRVAEVLAGPAFRHDSLAAASLIAYHFKMGGQELRSAEYFVKAGEYAQSLFANEEAIEHYHAALAAGHPETGHISEMLGDLYTLRGEYSHAITSYENAAALSKKDYPVSLEHKLGNVHARLGEWDLAVSHYQRAVEGIDTSCSDVERAGIYADWSQAEYQLGRPNQALENAEEALSTAEVCGDPLSLAQTYNILGILSRRSGNLEQALQYLENSLAAAERSNNLVAQIAAMNNLGHVYFRLGRLQDALAINQQALSKCIQIGDRHHEAALRNNLADLYYAAGNNDLAMQRLKEAVVIFSEIGLDNDRINPEIWKLTEW